MSGDQESSLGWGRRVVECLTVIGRLGRSLGSLRPALGWVSPRKILGAGAKNRTEIVQVTAQPQLTRKWVGDEVACLMDEILIPVPIKLDVRF